MKDHPSRWLLRLELLMIFVEAEEMGREALLFLRLSQRLSGLFPFQRLSGLFRFQRLLEFPMPVEPEEVGRLSDLFQPPDHGPSHHGVRPHGLYQEQIVPCLLVPVSLSYF